MTDPSAGDGGPPSRAVVLVEGLSDRAALQALAMLRGRDLAAEGVAIVAMGGAHAIGGYARRYGPQGLGVRLAGLYDAAEQGDICRGLERAGLGSGLTEAQLARLGFFVCTDDLEDELIRALGVPAVERVLHANAELNAFRTFAKQPAQRGRAPDQQLRRFLGTRSGRKIRYGRLLVEALDPGQVPRPLEAVLAHV
jgi:hypothetical protein